MQDLASNFSKCPIILKLYVYTYMYILRLDVSMEIFRTIKNSKVSFNLIKQDKLDGLRRINVIF